MNERTEDNVFGETGNLPQISDFSCYVHIHKQMIHCRVVCFFLSGGTYKEDIKELSTLLKSLRIT